MERADRKTDRRIDRRTFLKRGLAAGGLAGGGAAIWAAASSGPSARTPPNILVIIVDQLRFPQWFSPAAVGGPGLPPNLAGLRRGSVSFERHYTASNDCTPARSTLLTGLYTHQTGCMITGGSTLDPRFPTWGTMLREQGYETNWYGKWHLSHGDRRWNDSDGPAMLERYGFSGGTYPSPNGGPGQGWRVDPHIARQFERWFARRGGGAPWCTTVSLVNPHDISWWYTWTDRVRAEAQAPSTVTSLPPNYETPELLAARRKPILQRSLQSTSARAFGPVPFAGPAALPAWLGFLDLYVKLQGDVDENVGHVLRTLHSQPAVAANTVIVFTSDHGEYGASHGLRGKGAAAYEEGIRVPLLVRDPRGALTRGHGHGRSQLTSSVDVAPLLLTIATGSDAWRLESHYAHIAGRLDLARILAHPSAPGRPYVLHATDEILTEFATEPYAAGAPLHIAALRTADAKYATYSNWRPDTIDVLERHQESELYDYRTHGGRLEVDNSAGGSARESELRAQLERAVADELREPLPARLHKAQQGGFADYFTTAGNDARSAAKRRRRRLETIGPPLLPPAKPARRPRRHR
jgi:arylsulfatase A-like enzyme